MSGPLFDGRAELAMEDVVDDSRTEAGEAGLNVWHSILGGHIRERTGAYESRMVSEDQGFATVDHDHGSLYGPWLEGTGSQNAPVTVFPGYGSADQATGVLNSGEAEHVAEQVLRRHLPRMN
ncbi:hypothetical protein [Umezawaea tangerina]|uniref:Uncharacterized protein n=1 Tax=Umezawaea tangerina TaxID=84725 RepID=A0A2T0SPQ8_9PSEU|nr:hypothetical protein [Umezawaea tangerina]PRY35343.1 hypothetical protein CLV43_114261 [Umezawaea tangerina]